MSKVVDITDKLSFDENPKLVVKDKELEVNADATTVLKIMGMLDEADTPTLKEVISMYELLFGEKERKEIEEMKLPFSDFQTVVMTAISLVTGDDDQGEQ